MVSAVHSNADSAQALLQEHPPQLDQQQSECLDVLLQGLGEREQALSINQEVVSKGHLGQLLALVHDHRLDANCLLAAIAYHRLRQDSDFQCRLPEDAQFLLDGLTQLGQIETLRPSAADAEAAEGLRRLLLALVSDIRVVLLRVMDHLVAMRAVASAEDEDLRRQFARESSVIYAPLANRLGLWQLKWELEDLAFRYLQPDTYKRIAKLLAERRADREQYIQSVKQSLRDALQQEGIKGDVAGRPKHIFSIWKKMQRKQLDFDQLFDLRAVRVLVDSVADCYATLGIVHGLWQHIPKEFDDYIATPKANNYRSLHTAVIGPQGKALEVQIRTHEMHEHAELGVAAHWRYKEGGGDRDFDRKISAIRQMLEAREDAAEGMDDSDLLESFRSDLDDERVYALTPQGKVIDMPAGATVLDFAYHVHTQVGHRCRGAKINGRIVPLTRPVRTGEQVEILTGKEASPSRDWMSSRMGYLVSARSKQKVRQWFRRQDADSNQHAGRELLDQELLRMGLGRHSPESVLAKFNMQQLDSLYEAVGRGEVTPAQVARALDEHHHPSHGEPVALRKPPRRRKAGNEVSIAGVGDLLTRIASCCQPVPGDPIVGFITRGAGVTVHRRDCPNVAKWLSEDHPRLIDVAWENDERTGFRVDVVVEALDRKNLLNDVSGVISNAFADVLALQSHVDEASGHAHMRLSLGVENIEHLSEIIARLRGLPNVLEARREV
jgi:GTP pyrophosphokinase